MGQQRVNPDVSKLYITSGSYGPFMAPGTKFTTDHATNGPWECRFVKVDTGSVVIAAGDLVHWKDAEGTKTGTITNDYSDVGQLNAVAGIALVACTAAQALAGTAYLCILVNGYYPTVNTNGDDDISEGDALISAGADGTVNSVAANTAPTNKVVGWATADDVDADDTVAALVCVE